MSSIRRVLIATDFSHDANHAVTVGVELARALGARLTLLHVIQMPSYHFFGGGRFAPSEELSADIRADAARWLAAAKARVSGIEVETVCLEGDPATLLVEWAGEHKPDLIVVGTHGRRGVRKVLLGSVAERVVRDAKAPVLIVRGE